jgi:hypothetical protein
VPPSGSPVAPDWPPLPATIGGCASGGSKAGLPAEPALLALLPPIAVGAAPPMSVGSEVVAPAWPPANSPANPPTEEDEGCALSAQPNVAGTTAIAHIEMNKRLLRSTTVSSEPKDLPHDARDRMPIKVSVLAVRLNFRLRRSFSTWMRRVLANVLALGALTSCSVYDASLLNNGDLVAGDAGSSPLPGLGGASGVGGTAAAASSGMGGALHSAGTAGREPSAGTAGLAPSAGTTGVDNSAGAADVSGGAGGMPLNAGGAPAGGSAGSVGTGGSAAGAAGAPAMLPQELALGKPAIASSIQPGNAVSKGNDNNPSTRWCAVDQTMPQWW